MKYTSTINRVTLKKESSNFMKVKISSSKDASDVIHQFYTDDDIELFESFFILLLNRANTTIGYAKISQGGVAGTVVDPKIVAKYALDGLASGIILAHNHPSGELRASEADKTTTHKLTKGLKFLEIEVIDHLILSKDGYLSMKDEGII